MGGLPRLRRRVLDDGIHAHIHVGMNGQGSQSCMQLLEATGFPDAEVRALAHDPLDALECSILHALHAALGFGFDERFEFFLRPITGQAHHDFHHKQHFFLL